VTAVVVGMADGRLSADPGHVLATYALGSCIALAIHDPVAQVGGLLHFMLPDSTIDPEKARRNPWMFADTGIPLLFRQAYELGAGKRRLVVRAAGGANVMDDAGLFHIGKRNCLAMRKILWKAGVLIQEEEVGGGVSRTVHLEVGTGTFRVRVAGQSGG
jgi:chemotaxis protein CheD